MVVSTAFEELTEVLKRLETSDAEIRNVSMHEHAPDTDEELSADLTVGIPILPGVSLPDVSFDADKFDVQDQRIDVDLTVTLPLDGERSASALRRDEHESTVNNDRTPTQTPAIPPYKDPDALAAVYDEYDTFPEMTDALGVDVTSETVRRYMVEYDIHDPTDNTPHAHTLTPSSTHTELEREPRRDEETARTPQSEPNTPQPKHDTHENEPTPNGAQTHSNPDDTQTNSSTDDAPTDSGTDETEVDEFGHRSVAEMFAKSDSEQADDELIADGLGIPRDMSVAELASAVNESNTIHEVSRQLDMKQGNARRLLQKLNLIDVVVHRLAASQIKVSHEEIARRITTN